MLKICVLSNPSDTCQRTIVTAAMVRSFSAAQIDQLAYTDLGSTPASAVLINPSDDDAPLLDKLLSSSTKVLVLGSLTPAIAERLKLRLDPATEIRDCLATAQPDPDKPFNVSSLAVHYSTHHPLAQAAVINPRHLCRYDFTDEWNNLGYGRITTDRSLWSISTVADFDGSTALAHLADSHGSFVTAYMSLLDTPTGSTLWCNRQVGPVDSLEWNLVEQFFATHRPDDLPTFPYLSEIPIGYDGAVTARLDCDQAVASARRLFELYASRSMPLSLALQTGLSLAENDKLLIRDVLDNGGALLPHSVNHLPNWGPSYDTALREASDCKDFITRHFPKALPVKFAVSPAHQNPLYAVNALVNAGYKGLVAGIIHNDPEFLLSRAGQVPFIEQPFISHSQQCMFHGDCYHRYGNSIDVYKDSFHNHFKAGAIFGYLDHPCSAAYQYGWTDEEERLRAHQDLLDHLASFPNLWRPNLNQCLNFLLKRHSVRVGLNSRSRLCLEPLPRDTLPPVRIIHNGNSSACG